MKILSHITLWLAMAIMFLHNMTPHSHVDHSGPSSVTIVDQHSCEGAHWLHMLFAQDLGEGHLEYFTSVDIDDLNLTVDLDANFHFDIWASVQHLSKEVNQVQKIDVPPDDDSIQSLLFHSNQSLRGPPAISISC